MTPLWNANKAFLIKRRRTVEIELALEQDVFEKIKAAAELEGVSIEEFIELAVMEAVGLSYADLYCPRSETPENHNR